MIRSSTPLAFLAAAMVLALAMGLPTRAVADSHPALADEAAEAGQASTAEVGDIIDSALKAIPEIRRQRGEALMEAIKSGDNVTARNIQLQIYALNDLENMLLAPSGVGGDYIKLSLISSFVAIINTTNFHELSANEIRGSYRQSFQDLLSAPEIFGVRTIFDSPRQDVRAYEALVGRAIYWAQAYAYQQVQEGFIRGFGQIALGLNDFAALLNPATSLVEGITGVRVSGEDIGRELTPGERTDAVVLGVAETLVGIRLGQYISENTDFRPLGPGRGDSGPGGRSRGDRAAGDRASGAEPPARPTGAEPDAPAVQRPGPRPQQGESGDRVVARVDLEDINKIDDFVDSLHLDFRINVDTGEVTVPSRPVFSAETRKMLSENLETPNQMLGPDGEIVFGPRPPTTLDPRTFLPGPPVPGPRPRPQAETGQPSAPAPGTQASQGVPPGPAEASPRQRAPGDADPRPAPLDPGSGRPSSTASEEGVLRSGADQLLRPETGGGPVQGSGPPTQLAQQDGAEAPAGQAGEQDPQARGPDRRPQAAPPAPRPTPTPGTGSFGGFTVVQPPGLTEEEGKAPPEPPDPVSPFDLGSFPEPDFSPRPGRTPPAPSSPTDVGQAAEQPPQAGGQPDGPEPTAESFPGATAVGPDAMAPAGLPPVRPELAQPAAPSTTTPRIPPGATAVGTDAMAPGQPGRQPEPRDPARQPEQRDESGVALDDTEPISAPAEGVTLPEEDDDGEESPFQLQIDPQITEPRFTGPGEEREEPVFPARTKIGQAVEQSRQERLREILGDEAAEAPLSDIERALLADIRAAQFIVYNLALLRDQILRDHPGAATEQPDETEEQKQARERYAALGALIEAYNDYIINGVLGLALSIASGEELPTAERIREMIRAGNQKGIIDENLKAGVFEEAANDPNLSEGTRQQAQKVAEGAQQEAEFRTWAVGVGAEATVTAGPPTPDLTDRELTERVKKLEEQVRALLGRDGARDAPPPAQIWPGMLDWIAAEKRDRADVLEDERKLVREILGAPFEIRARYEPQASTLDVKLAQEIAANRQPPAGAGDDLAGGWDIDEINRQVEAELRRKAEAAAPSDGAPADLGEAAPAELGEPPAGAGDDLAGGWDLEEINRQVEAELRRQAEAAAPSDGAPADLDLGGEATPAELGEPPAEEGTPAEVLIVIDDADDLTGVIVLARVEIATLRRQLDELSNTNPTASEPPKATDSDKEREAKDKYRELTQQIDNKQSALVGLLSRAPENVQQEVIVAVSLAELRETQRTLATKIEERNKLFPMARFFPSVNEEGERFEALTQEIAVLQSRLVAQFFQLPEDVRRLLKARTLFGADNVERGDDGFFQVGDKPFQLEIGDSRVMLSPGSTFRFTPRGDGTARIELRSGDATVTSSAQNPIEIVRAENLVSPISPSEFRVVANNEFKVTVFRFGVVRVASPRRQLVFTPAGGRAMNVLVSEAGEIIQELSAPPPILPAATPAGVPNGNAIDQALDQFPEPQIELDQMSAVDGLGVDGFSSAERRDEAGNPVDAVGAAPAPGDGDGGPDPANPGGGNGGGNGGGAPVAGDPGGGGGDPVGGDDPINGAPGPDPVAGDPINGAPGPDPVAGDPINGAPGPDPVADDPINGAPGGGEVTFDTRLFIIERRSAQADFFAIGAETSVTQDAEENLIAYDWPDIDRTDTRGTAQSLERGSTADPNNPIFVERWAGGTFNINGMPGPALAANQGRHFVYGTPSEDLPLAGRFNYDLAAATRPTYSDGGTAPGELTRAEMRVEFGRPMTAENRAGIDMALSMDVEMPDHTYRIRTSGFRIENNMLVPTDFTSTGSALGFDQTRSFRLPRIQMGDGGRACTAAGFCGAEVSGFFGGRNGSGVGIVYGIGDGFDPFVTGAAAFERAAP